MGKGVRPYTLVTVVHVPLGMGGEVYGSIAPRSGG